MTIKIISIHLPDKTLPLPIEILIKTGFTTKVSINDNSDMNTKEEYEFGDQVVAKKGSKHIGANVRRTREIRGLRQFELANLLGVKPQTVGDYENSKTLRKPTLEKIAEALKVSPEFIEDFNEEAFDKSITNIINAENVSDVAALQNTYYGETTSNLFPLNETIEFLKEEVKYYREQNQQNIEQIKLLLEKLYKKNKD